jgi:mRNA interferase MazF
MTSFRRGDVVVVSFPFTDLSAARRRPALVLSTDEYIAKTGDLIIAQITSRVNSPARPGDYRLRQWQQVGLNVSSLVRARMTTLHSSKILRTVGRLSTQEMASAGQSIASALGL